MGPGDQRDRAGAHGTRLYSGEGLTGGPPLSGTARARAERERAGGSAGGASWAEQRGWAEGKRKWVGLS
jgi:hypothetical protein